MTHWRLKLKRRLVARRLADNPLAALLRSPLPAGGTLVRDAELVCLDIETTGLDPATAEMLSIGWVLIQQGRVVLETAERFLVCPPGDVGDSATIHGLTDTICSDGEPAGEVLTRLLVVLRGRVLVVHFGALDKSLLDRLGTEYFGAGLIVPVIDTLELEHRLRRRRHHLDDNQSLRLVALRQSYNLPTYMQHDSLADAIATGELLLAMIAFRGGVEEVRLRNLLC